MDSAAWVASAAAALASAAAALAAPAAAPAGEGGGLLPSAGARSTAVAPDALSSRRWPVHGDRAPGRPRLTGRFGALTPDSQAGPAIPVSAATSDEAVPAVRAEAGPDPRAADGAQPKRGCRRPGSDAVPRRGRRPRPPVQLGDVEQQVAAGHPAAASQTRRGQRGERPVVRTGAVLLVRVPSYAHTRRPLRRSSASRIPEPSASGSSSRIPTSPTSLLRPISRHRPSRSRGRHGRRPPGRAPHGAPDVGGGRGRRRTDRVDAVDRVEPTREDQALGDRPRHVGAVPEVGEAVERLRGDDPGDLRLADPLDVGERDPDAVGAAVRQVGVERRWLWVKRVGIPTDINRIAMRIRAARRRRSAARR